MAAVDATPGGGTVLTESTARLHSEKNEIPDRSMYQGGYRWEGWFWEFLSSEDGQKRFFVDLPHAVPGSSLSAKIRFWGAKIPTRSDSGEPTQHHLRVTVNGSSLGQLFSWGGTQPSISLTPFDVEASGLPAADPTEFRFLVPEVPSVDPLRLDLIHLTWIDVSYRRVLALDGAPGELEVDAGPAGRTFRFASPPSGNLHVIDVTDFRRPRRLTGVQVSGQGADFALGRTTSAVIAVSADGGFAVPVDLQMDEPPSSVPGAGAGTWLRSTTDPLDYVIIAHDDLVNEAELLADWRRDHLYPFTPGRRGNVRVVKVSDVMDEFTWGMWDPAALRYFLEYAYEFYGSAMDAPLSYVLFLGDSTNDPRDYAGTGVPDYVPSWEDTRDDIARIGWGSVQFVSDDPLARFDDPDAGGCPDQLTDLYLGRITATTPAEARDILVDKVIRSEKNPDYGSWRLKAILVADDRCQGTRPDALGSVHMIQMEQVSDLLPPLFTQDKIYLYEYGNDCVFTSKPEAKQALISSWSDGAWLVNYIGHGADVVWADEHVLDLADTPLLTNDGRLPVVGSFSCSVGKFSNPSRDGLGESHLRNPRGGSLVSAAASHLTSSFSNVLFNLEFMTQLFVNGVHDPVPIGVALMQAKRIRTDGENWKYVCLGDPGSRLSVPEMPLDLTGPSRLDRGTTVQVSVTVPGNAGREGKTEVVARDARILRDTDEEGDPIAFSFYMPGALIFRGQADMVADTSGLEFTVPASLRGGDDGSIRSYASGQDWDAAEALVPLSVGGLVTSNPDSLGPQISFSVTSGMISPGENLRVTLEDPAGINLTQLFEFRSILLRVHDRSGLEQFRQDITPRFEYESGSHTRGHLDFVVPELEAAPYAFTVSATDNYNNRSVQSVDLEVGALTGAVEFDQVLGAFPNPFNPEEGPTRVLFSLSRSAEVTALVYSVSGRLVWKETLDDARPGPNEFVWRGRDRANDPVANGVYLVQLTTRGEEADDDRRHLERVVVLR
jgi:hypothetical protein